MSTLNPAIHIRMPSQRAGLVIVVSGIMGLAVLFTNVVMNNYEIRSARLSTDKTVPISASANGPVITIISDNRSSYPNGQIPKYEKFEVTFTIGNVGTAFTDYNPFNPNIVQISSDYWNKKGILVDAILTSSTGQSITYPCFWYEGTDGWKGWKLRFAPMEIGTWAYRIRAKYSTGEAITSELPFDCIASSNHGFIRVNPADPRFFQFSDGTPFYPIGCATSGWDRHEFLESQQVILAKLNAVGGNFTRVYASIEASNPEPYCIGSDKSVPKALCNYNMSNARTNDTVVELARQNGIYMEWLLDDWTRWKGYESQYIRYGSRGAPCGNYQETFDFASAREVYKRKIRYVIARWGYSPNIMAFELMNEIYADPNSCDVAGWHKELGNYIQSLAALPHMTSSSNGSFRLRTTAGIPWNDASMSFVNYHAYAIADDVVSWNTLEAGGFHWEKLGSTLASPWMDTAVWVDRTSRVYNKRHKWKKPLIWSEYGLIKVSSEGLWKDWQAAYLADSEARHNKDAIWAGLFTTIYVCHWKSGWVMGHYDSGPDKFWVYAALSNYVAGEDFTGLKQETSYAVEDPLNPVPQTESSNSAIMAMSLHSTSRAYLYVKNLTDCWYKCVDPSSVPTPTPQSGTVTIKGMTPGNYTLEQWSTNEVDRLKQILAVANITVGNDGNAYVQVNLGVDAAYKLKPVNDALKVK